MQGWIKLFRKIVNHWLYFAEPFDRFHAFMDLLILCNRSDSKIMIDGVLSNIGCGEMITSIRSLCERWKWSNTKVKRFLNELEDDEMITVKSDSKKTVIKVHNYEKYQGCTLSKNDAETSQKHFRNDTETFQKHTFKNVKNDKNIKNEREKEKETDFKIIEFKAPSLSEVRKFIEEEKLNVNGQKFFNYYTANGWTVGGKAQMLDWKAKCREWSSTEQAKPKRQGGISTAPTYNLEQIKADAMKNTEIKY